MTTSSAEVMNRRRLFEVRGAQARASAVRSTVLLVAEGQTVADMPLVESRSRT